VALFVVSAVGVIVGLRLARDGVQPYGADGAQYIEHAARLAVLRTVETVGPFRPWRLLVASDGSFPPLMHLLSVVPGSIFGHGAGVAAATGFGWLLLLAFAVGWTAAGVTGRSAVAAPAAAATLLVPAAHGFATRYYYDLPMIALLWLGVACVLAGRDRRPLLAGGAAGLLLFAAAVTKWAALAFGAPMLVGALITGWAGVRQRGGGRRLVPPRLLCGVACAVVAVALCAAFLVGRSGDNSFATMGRVAFAEGSPADWDGREDAPGALGAAAGQVIERIGQLEAADLAFYPLRLVTSVFSPVLALLLGLLLLRWLGRGRQGLALVLVVGAGHALFLLGVMPVLDDRFALVGAPALVVVATCAWASMERQPRDVVGILVVVVGLAVALDFHFGAPALWNAEVQVLAPDRDDFPPTWLRGVGLAGSVEGRGWSRHDATPSPRQPLRDLTWGAVSACRPEGIGVELERPLIVPDGDAEWLRYRALLSEAVDGRPGPRIGGLCPPDGGPWDGDGRLDLALLATDRALPGCLRGYRWWRVQELQDPDGGPGLALWAHRGTGACRTTP
jgi:hypothetical protein